MKFPFCDGCPLKGSPGPVPASGTPGGLVIVGEAPGREEITQKQPFVGRSGQLLRQTLHLLGDPPTFITNAVLCYPGQGVAPSAQAIKACSQRLWDDFSRAQPKVLLLLGNTAIKAVFPDERSGILRLRGSLLYSEALRVYAIPTLHPAAVLRVPRQFRAFAKDIEKACATLHTPPTLPSRPQTLRITSPVELAAVCSSLRDWISQENQQASHGVSTRESLGTMEDLPVVTGPTGRSSIGAESSNLSGGGYYHRAPGPSPTFSPKVSGGFLPPAQGYAVVDIETSGVDPLVDRILRIGLLVHPSQALIIYPTAWAGCGRWQLKALLEDGRICWVGHNGGLFDSQFLKTHLGIDWRPRFDTMLAHYSLDEESQTHSLKQLAVDYFNAPLYREALVKHQQSTDIKFAALPDDLLDEYLSWDLLFTWLLVPRLSEEMEREGVRKVHDDLLVPASLALRDVELRGILVDQEYLVRVGSDLKKDKEGRVKAIQGEYNVPGFNPNSPKQVAELLYQRARVPAPPGGSTAREYLEKIDHPLVKEILEIRTIERLISTYINGILKRVAPDGRIRTDFLLHRSSTGRLASSNPNLQNIPILYGPQIRDAFIATPGWELLEADYSQLELRVAAWYSGDEALCEAYRTGQDIHTLVASEIYKKPPEEVTKLERYMAKYVDFGILYGRGPKTLAEQLNCSVEEASLYIDRFFERFWGIYQWLQEQRRLARERGYVETPLGRRRRFSLITDDNLIDVEHQAGNSPIQSLASDLCLSALIRLNDRLDPDVARVLLTVHDSILFEVRTGSLSEVVPIVRYEMSENLPIDGRGIPFEVELAVGERWGSLKELAES